MNFISNFLNSSGVLENAKIEELYSSLITGDEQIEVGFKLNEDIFIFTNKRLLLVEKLREEESMISYLSFPYSNISHFSVEAKKSFDHKATLKIWLYGQHDAALDKAFNKSVDVYEVQKILAGHVLK